MITSAGKPAAAMIAGVDTPAAAMIVGVDTPDAAALATLHDIVLPPAVSWWPLAPGWYVVVGIALLALVPLALHAVRRRRARAYRREAMREIDALERRAVSGAAPRDMLAELAALLRRVALHAAPRERVAALAGPDWIEHLTRMAGAPLAPAVADALLRAPYARDDGHGDADHSVIDAAFVTARRCVRRHRTAVRSGLS